MRDLVKEHTLMLELVRTSRNCVALHNEIVDLQERLGTLEVQKARCRTELTSLGITGEEITAALDESQRD